MNIEFTVDQINQILQELSGVPYKWSATTIQFIEQIANAQLAAQRIQEQAIDVQEDQD